MAGFCFAQAALAPHRGCSILKLRAGQERHRKSRRSLGVQPTPRKLLHFLPSGQFITFRACPRFHRSLLRGMVRASALFGIPTAERISLTTSPSSVRDALSRINQNLLPLRAARNMRSTSTTREKAMYLLCRHFCSYMPLYGA